MHHTKGFILRSRKRQPKQDQHAVALITTLLLLMLLTGLTLSMAWSARSDMLINGYYRNFRGSFYAADSGLNAVRTAMVNEVVAAIPPSFSINQQPIPTGTDATIQADINSAYGQSYRSYTGQGQATDSWPGQYKVTDTFVLASC